MAKPSKVWRIVPPQAEIAERLGRELVISPVVAQVMVNRGIDNESAARRFLFAGAETLGDPFLMLGMDRAADRIQKAIADHEKIAIYGDYDVDGVTATALVYRVLRQLGGVVEYYIPERQSEGYGLNQAALEHLHKAGCQLVITVDCGIGAVTEVAALAGRLDIIVTDHHQPPTVLPSAYVVINPKQPGCPYPDKNLAGVGVAYKLCQALWQRCAAGGPPTTDFLDIVAVGTIADIVPLTGENRIIVKLGLEVLAKTVNHGLKALIAAAGLADDKIDGSKVGYSLAPRLNAAGRVSHAAAGVELLITDNQERATELAALLDSENARRQAVEKELLAAADLLLEGTDPTEQKVLVLAGDDWHPGVIGIVASRLVDRYYRPVVMISVRDGVGKGSCRSIPGFDIYRALEQCSDLLIQFGGHQQAAGLSIEPANIDHLRDRLNVIAATTLSAADYQPVLNIDAAIALEEIDASFLQQLACLAPHGAGNPSPVFVCEDLAVAGVRPVGQEGRHLKLKVKRRSATNDVIAWNMGALADKLDSDAAIDLAFFPEFNEWQGQRTIQLKAHDVHLRSSLPETVRLTDARDIGDKSAYAAQVAAGGRKTLLLVSNRREALQVARRLSPLLPAKNIACWHLALSAKRKKQVWEAFADGKIEVLIAAGRVEGAGTDIDDIIAWSPPLSAQSLTEWCQLAASQAVPVTMHFVYGAADLREAAVMLEEIFPERAIVAWLYLALKESADQNGAVNLTGRQLTRAVARRSGATTVGETAVATGIAVLAEIGLLDRNEGDTFQLKPPPVHKLALEGSPTFGQGQQAKDSFPALARRLMRSSPAKLWKQAADGE